MAFPSKPVTRLGLDPRKRPSPKSTRYPSVKRLTLSQPFYIFEIRLPPDYTQKPVSYCVVVPIEISSAGEQNNMLMNPNMLMDLHKARERELLLRAKSSRLPKLADPSRHLLTERFVQAFNHTFGFWGLR